MREQTLDRPTVEREAKWFVVVNPASGSGKGLDDFPLISKLLRDNGIRCESVFTEHKCHATELTVSAINSGYRHIIVVGGDGTLHEVVNGLFIQQEVTPSEVLLAIIPVGTGNDFVRCFGGSQGFMDIAAQLDASPMEIDVIKCNDDYAVNMINVGFDCQAAIYASEMKKKAFIPAKLVEGSLVLDPLVNIGIQNIVCHKV